jgi:fucose permease
MNSVESPQQPPGEETVILGSRRDSAYTSAAAVLGFLAGAFGFLALMSDLSDDPLQHYVELAALHAVLAIFVGGLARGRWYVSIIVAWGAMVWGLPLKAILGGADWLGGWDTWSYAAYGYGVVVPVTIAGGFFGNWLAGKIAR